MKNETSSWKTPVLIVCWILAICAIFYGVGSHVMGYFHTPGISTGKTVTNTVELSDSITSLEVDAALSDMSVSYGDSLSISYSYPEKLVPTIDVEGSTLKIYSGQKGVNLNLGNGYNFKDSYYLNIVIPEGTKLTSVTIDNDCGNLELVGLTGTSLSVDADMGDVDAKDLSFTSATMTLDCGDMDMTGCSFSSLTADNNMGDICFADGSFDSGSFDCDMGNIDISGDYAQISADCSMGDIDLNTDRPESEVMMNLNVDMGDISVNGHHR